MDSTIGRGLCATCVFAKIFESDRGSRFLRCSLSGMDPRFSKYPRLPVLECTGWKFADCDFTSPKPLQAVKQGR